MIQQAFRGSVKDVLFASGMFFQLKEELGMGGVREGGFFCLFVFFKEKFNPVKY